MTKTLCTKTKDVEIHQATKGGLLGNVFISNLEKAYDKRLNFAVVDDDAKRGVIYALSGDNVDTTKKSLDLFLRSNGLETSTLFSRWTVNHEIGLTKVPFHIGEKKVKKVKKIKPLIESSVTLSKNNFNIHHVKVNRNIFSNILVKYIHNIIENKDVVFVHGDMEVAVFYSKEIASSVFDTIDTLLQSTVGEYKIVEILPHSAESETKYIVKRVFALELL